MKGWPLLRAFLTLVALLLAGLPLRSLTRQKTEPVFSEPIVRSTEKISVALTFTQPPEKFSLKYLGKEILSGGESATFDLTTSLETNFPPEGIDLVFEGLWPEYFRKIGVNVKVTRANGIQQVQTIWGKRKIFQLLTFTGTEPP